VKQGGGGLVCIDREKNNTFTQLQKQHLATEINTKYSAMLVSLLYKFDIVCLCQSVIVWYKDI